MSTRGSSCKRSRAIPLLRLRGACSLLSSNQFPSVPELVPRVTKIISKIHVRKRSSSHVSSFTVLKTDTKKKRANWRKRFYLWLFLSLLVIFLTFLFPTDNICEFHTSFTINQHSTRDEMLCIKKGRAGRTSGIVSTVFFQRRKAFKLFALAVQELRFETRYQNKVQSRCRPLTHSCLKRWSIRSWHKPQQEQGLGYDEIQLYICSNIFVLKLPRWSPLSLRFLLFCAGASQKERGVWQGESSSALDTRGHVSEMFPTYLP